MKAKAIRGKRRQRAHRTVGNRGACAWHLRTRALRLLGKAIGRVPPGPNLDRLAHFEQKTWDTHTGLFLPKVGARPEPQKTTLTAFRAWGKTL